MAKLETFPTAEELQKRMTSFPQFMRPNGSPFAVWYEGFLSGAECDAIIEEMETHEPYTVRGCGAITRECHEDPVLNTIEQFARGTNGLYWNYDLDPGQHSWFQTYDNGAKYQAHMDGEPGQTRKLTAVALLSDESDYVGGDLRLVVVPKSLWVPRKRGTVVVFLPWMVHEVKPVSSGLRQTINMGFWGPPFK